MTPSFDPTMPPPEVLERWRKERITNFGPDELREWCGGEPVLPDDEYIVVERTKLLAVAEAWEKSEDDAVDALVCTATQALELMARVEELEKLDFILSKERADAAESAVLRFRVDDLERLLGRLFRWDHMDTAADGAYWRVEIAAALAGEE